MKLKFAIVLAILLVILVLSNSQASDINVNHETECHASQLYTFEDNADAGILMLDPATFKSMKYTGRAELLTNVPKNAQHFRMIDRNQMASDFRPAPVKSHDSQIWQPHPDVVKFIETTGDPAEAMSQFAVAAALPHKTSPYFASLDGFKSDPVAHVEYATRVAHREQLFQIEVPRTSVFTDDIAGTAHVLVPTVKIVTRDGMTAADVTASNGSITTIALPSTAIKKVNNTTIRVAVPLSAISTNGDNVVLSIPRFSPNSKNKREAFAATVPEIEAPPEPNYCVSFKEDDIEDGDPLN